ncbi:MAG TPA: cupin [Patescibacteria group bacterium]|jgi:mannose-6-phosphate isomerase-like protein (cupin superfamily)|nr:cupin [Patescibacteria group bacterium]
MIDLSQFDKTKFDNSPYSKKIEKPWGWEIHWVPEDRPYMGKVLHINEGKRLSLQVHDQKQESWFLMNGKAKIIWDNQNGELIETELENGKGYSCSIGQRHRLVGITDCDVLEVSTPEMGTTLRLEDDYKRPDETPEQRKIERGEK